MNEFPALLLAFLLFGSCLLFWPAYRLLHPKKTRRRQALLVLFIVEVAVYAVATGLVILGFSKVPDFHHALLFVYAGYLFLNVIGWVATALVCGTTALEPPS